MNQRKETGLDMLTKAELAVALAVSQRHVSNLMEQGLPHVKLGRCLRFSCEDVKSWIRDTQSKDSPL